MRHADDNFLTDLEINILQLLAEGRSKVWIETQLSLSRATLYRYLENIRHKLGARNNTHAVAIALDQAIINPKEKLSRVVGDSLGEEASSSLSVPVWNHLTRREKEIFLLLGEVESSQATNRQLARQLNVAEATLKKHLQRIYHKLGVSNRSGAALLAAQARQQLALDRREDDPLSERG